MAEDQIQTPAFTATKLKKTCFTSIQEMFEEFAAGLVFSDNIVRLVQGAKGEKGDSGNDGESSVGGGGSGSSNIQYMEEDTIINIPNGSTYVEVPATQLLNDKFKILSKREVNTETAIEDGGYPDFEAADGYFALGPMVLDAENDKTRIYFVFTAGISAVPNENFALVWTKKVTSL